MAAATFFLHFLEIIVILKVTMWLIQSARWLLVVFVWMVATTPFLLYYTTDLSLIHCFVISLEIAMSEPPTDFEHILFAHGSAYFPFYMAWLFGLQLLSWLIIPILVGVIVQEGEREIERRVIARQERLRQIRGMIEASIEDSLITSGADPESANRRAKAIRSQWDKMLDTHVAVEGRIERIIRQIKELVQRP